MLTIESQRNVEYSGEFAKLEKFLGHLLALFPSSFMTPVFVIC